MQMQIQGRREYGDYADEESAKLNTNVHMLLGYEEYD